MIKNIIILCSVLFFMTACGHHYVNPYNKSVYVANNEMIDTSMPTAQKKQSISYKDKNFIPGKPFISSGHISYITDMKLLGNDRYLATSADDMIIKIWDLKQDKVIKELVAHTSYGLKLAVSSDGKYLVSSSWDKQVIVWDIKKGKILKKKKFKGIITGIRVTSENNIIISTGISFEIWDINLKNKLTEIKGLIVPVLSNISKNRRYIVYSGKKKQLFLYDLKTHKNIRKYIFNEKKSYISSIIISDDMKKLFATVQTGKILEFDLDTTKLVHSYQFSNDKNFKEYPSALILIKNKYLFAGGHNNKYLKIWDMKTKKLIKEVKNENNNIFSIVKVPEENKIIYSNDNDLVFLETNNFKITKIIKSNGYQSINFVKNNQFLSVNFNGAVSLNKVDGLKVEEKPLHKFDNAIFYTDVADKKSVFFDAKKSIFSLDIQNKELKKLYSVNDARGLSISSDDKFMAFSDLTGVKVLDLQTNKITNTFNAPSEHFAEYLDKRTLQIFAKSQEFTKLKNLEITAYWINRLKYFNHSDKILATLSKVVKENKNSYRTKHIIAIADTKTGKWLKQFEEAHKSLITLLRISPDNKHLVSVGWDNKMFLWDIDSGKVIQEFKGNIINIADVFFEGKDTLISIDKNKMIRYWDINSGKELYAKAIFDDGEWVIITPEGYFDTSENGAKYLSIQTAPMKVASINQYYETFYRPDIVAAAMKGRKIDTGITIAQVKSAPTVEFINTIKKTDKQNMEIKLKIKDNGGGVGDIRLYINGTAIKNDKDRALLRKNDGFLIKTYNIKLNNGRNKIKAVAYNEAGTMSSNEASINISANYIDNLKPNLYALVIGIDEYKNPKLQLRYAVNDAKLFTKILKVNTNQLFNKVYIDLIVNPQNATKNNLIKRLNSYKKLNPNDLFIFYVASHGTVDDGEYFLITSNVGSTSTRKLKKDAIRQSDLKDLIANIPSTKKIIIFDTCNAGKIGDTLQMAMLTRGMSEDTAMKVLSRAVGSLVLSAATSQQEALEGYNGHGLFTYVLAEGLSGKADLDNDGYVKTRELSNYVEDEVPLLAERIYNRAQYPVVSPVGQGFPIVKIK